MAWKLFNHKFELEVSNSDNILPKIEEKDSPEMSESNEILKSTKYRIYCECTDGIYMCDYPDCTNSYRTKGALMAHRREDHNMKEFLCKICGKSYGRNGTLKDHEKTHLRAFKCSNCDKTFPQMYMLKGHIKLHHEGHRYYCPTCGQSFLTPHSLQRHELTHTGVKDFKCDICPLAFYTKQELFKHKQYHNGVRPHICTVCRKTYVEKNHLVTHMRTHTGEKPYNCDVSTCTKSFSSSSRLKRHKTNVHHMLVEPKLRSFPRFSKTLKTENILINSC